eukprot:39052_1
MTQMNSQQTIGEEEEHKMRSQLNLQIPFVEPRESDYIDCKTNNHTVNNCNVMTRILHLLTYYQQHSKMEIYEYVTCLKNYDVPTFMEDWHQTKNNHLRVENAINWVNNGINLECNDKGCEYVGRYKRERGNDMYDNIKADIDYKNIILTDQLDSIHTFVFHSIRRQTANRAVKNIECKYNDRQIDQKQEEKQQFIWSNTPESILECNAAQVINIISNVIFDKLKRKQRDVLISYKLNIIEYVKEHKCDGSKLHAMKRKTFITNVMTYLNVNDNKLKQPLGAIYSSIMQYDISLSFQDEKQNKLRNTVQQCNVDHIVCVTEHVIANKVNKLSAYKQNIIAYMKQNKVDGNKLLHTKRKTFLEEIITHLDVDDNKLKGPLAALYTAIIKYDVSRLIFKEEEKSIDGVLSNDELKEDAIHSSTKFQTSMALHDENDSYYSFGTQYRYTKNLQQHPFYVEAKYYTLKEELIVYFTNKDTQILLKSQVEAIQSMKPDVQAIIMSLVKDTMSVKQHHDDSPLWLNDDALHYTTSTLLKIADKSSKQLISIVTELCSGSADAIKGTNFVSILFLELLKTKKTIFETIKQLIENDVKLYFRRQYPPENHPNKQTLLKNIRVYISNRNSDNNGALDRVIKDATDVYKYIFDNYYLKRYATENIDMQTIIDYLKDEYSANQFSQQISQGNNSQTQLITIFYTVLFTRSIQSIHQFDPIEIKHKLSQYNTLQQIRQETEEWLGNGFIPQLETVQANQPDFDQIIPVIEDMFTVNLCEELQIDELKAEFVTFAIETIKEQLSLSKQIIKSQASIRAISCIKQAESKIQMPSVKTMKAAWYEGMNKDHYIKANQPIQIDHISALVVYTQYSDVCTAFRQTYRKTSNNEAIYSQIKRHSMFANFGRLLYESFVFYGS